MMRKGLISVLIGIVSFGLLAACGGKETYKPVDIQAGVDKCEVCHMLISDNEHATEIVLKDKRVLKFDDIGDMFVWLKENGEEQVGAKFVRDYHTKEWVELKKATFVYDPGFHTPMGYGVLSFQSEEEADKFIQEQGTGRKMKPADLANHTWEQHATHGQHGDGHDHADHAHHQGSQAHDQQEQAHGQQGQTHDHEVHNQDQDAHAHDHDDQEYRAGEQHEQTHDHQGHTDEQHGHDSNH